LFVWPLLVPTNAVPVGVVTDTDAAGVTRTNALYHIYMRAGSNQFHPELPFVPIWGYTDSPTANGSTPGPTIQATNGQPVQVRWIDHLPAHYPAWIPADTSNHGVTGQEVRNVVHLHGGATRPLFDGNPTYWFRPGTETNYFYDNIDLSHEHDGETLWYHDHALGVTANNVYAGLASLYLLRNPTFEQSLPLPVAPYDVPLVFQDRDIQRSIYPPTLISDLATTNVAPWHYLPVVNGLVAPYFEVEPRRYRFRVLNGCSFRTIGLALVTENTSASGVTNANVPMYQIGTDDGFLPTAVVIPGAYQSPPPAARTLRLMPSERADLIVDFTQWKGSTIVVTNDIGAGDASAPPLEPINVVDNAFLQFRVGDTAPAEDPSRDFSTNLVIHPAAPTAQALAARAVKTRRITLELRIELPNPGMEFAQDPHLFALLNMSHFDAPVTDAVQASSDLTSWQSLTNAKGTGMTLYAEGSHLNI
jgi:spore coat protein A